MALLVLLSIAVLVLVIARGTIQYWKGRGRKLPPGPPAWPIIGSLHHLISGAPHKSLAKLAQKYGPLVYMKLGSVHLVLVSSSETAKLFLQTHDKSFASRPPMESANWLGYGQDSAVSIARYGDKWRQLRRFYTLQLFTARRVNEYMPVVVEEIERLLEKVKGYAEAEIAVDMTAAFGALLSDIICRILMNKKPSEVWDEKLGCNLKEVVQEGVALSALPVLGDVIPWLSCLDGKVKRKMDAWHASVDALLESVLVARQKEGAPASPDFLQLLLSENLARDRVKSVILELILAGVDTSSTTLDWVMAELMLNQEVLMMVEDDVGRVMSHSSSKMVQEKDLPQLVYIKAVIKETLRLHTPAPLLVPHMATQDCHVGGYDIPQDTRLLVNAWAIGRDPEVWDSPNTFLPDRFLSPCKHVDVHGENFELIPFGSGRRGCPGRVLALPIMEMVLANLVHSFCWSLPPPPDHRVDMSERFSAVACRATPLLVIPTIRSH